MKKIATLIFCVTLLGFCAKSQASFTPVASYQVTSLEVYINPTIPEFQDSVWVQVPNNPTQEEIDAYLATLNQSYVGTSLLYGPAGEISFAGHIGTEARDANGTDVVWYFEVAGCPTCSKALKMLILSESPTGIVFAMQDEDGNLKFQPKFTFIKL
jgi:hypothetical protein